jgi:hypothetical protein
MFRSPSVVIFMEMFLRRLYYKDNHASVQICEGIILRFKYLYIKYFWFYSDSEASVRGREIFKIYRILKFAVGYFLLVSVLMTESSIPDCCFES